MPASSSPRFVVSFAVAMAASGCMVPLHTRGQRNPEPAQVLARKLVVGKEAPLDLIAEDGSRCLTTKDRFEKTRIGSKVWCLWSGDPQRDFVQISSINADSRARTR